jgi:hypothetical protein
VGASVEIQNRNSTGIDNSDNKARLKPESCYQKEGESSMRYLVTGSDGPGFGTPEEALQILEKVVLPSVDALNRLQAEKRILAGGLKVGERSFVFVAEAESNEKLDRMLREIPFWGMVKWEVTPLESFETRAVEEREMTARLRGPRNSR